MPAIPKAELMNSTKTVAMTQFAIDYSLTEKCGSIIQTSAGGGRGYKLGPNLQFTLPVTTYTISTEPADASMRATYNWNGEHYVGIQPIDLTTDVTNKLFRVDNNRLELSLLVEGRFNNLNTSLKKIVGVRQRTVMVYSDVVQSTLVGSGKFPLLREVQLSRVGDGRSTVEPLRHQWIKVRGNQLDIIEVEIANPDGKLTDTVLRSLALDDPQLRRVFHGVYPADQLPRFPCRTLRAAYIVNTDPADEPGQHWLGLRTEQNKCENFDSYGLPLHVYKDPDLHRWWSKWQ